MPVGGTIASWESSTRPNRTSSSFAREGDKPSVFLSRIEALETRESAFEIRLQDFEIEGRKKENATLRCENLFLVARNSELMIEGRMYRENLSAKIAEVEKSVSFPSDLSAKVEDLLRKMGEVHLSLDRVRTQPPAKDWTLKFSELHDLLSGLI